MPLLIFLYQLVNDFLSQGEILNFIKKHGTPDYICQQIHFQAYSDSFGDLPATSQNWNFLRNGFLELQKQMDTKNNWYCKAVDIIKQFIDEGSLNGMRVFT